MERTRGDFPESEKLRLNLKGVPFRRAGCDRDSRADLDWQRCEQLPSGVVDAVEGLSLNGNIDLTFRWMHVYWVLLFSRQDDKHHLEDALR